MDRRSFNKTMGVFGAGVFSGLGPQELGASREPRAEWGGSIDSDYEGVPRVSGEFDVARARRETPGCDGVVHFNNAGSSLPPQPVLDAVIGHLEFEGEIGGYEAADAAAAERQRTYDAVAHLLNCQPDEVALVENATRGWDMAFYSMAFQPGDRILTCAAEYASNYIAYLQVAKRTGAVVEIIPDDASGQVSVDALRAELRKGRVALVGITHVPTNGGLVNPAEEIGELTRGAGVPYLLDACQSAGQWPLDVERIGCDMLSVTGRKFLRGPRGTGFLYVRKEMIRQLEPPLLDLHAAEWTERDDFRISPTARRFENWESYVAGGIGLGGVTVRDLGQEKCGIVTFTMAGREPAELKGLLRQRRVNVSVTSRSSTRIDMEDRGLDSMVRASVHYYNTEEELERFVEMLGEI